MANASSVKITPYIGQALPASIIWVSNRSLFAIAAQKLGDATQWYRIAELNAAACTNAMGELDPWIGPPTQIAIPQPGLGNGGIPTYG